MLAASLIQVSDPADRRSDDDRLRIDQPSTLRTDAHSPRDVMVDDICSTGFRFVVQPPLAVGTTVAVGLSGAGVTRARIVWSRDGVHGCEFEQPLSAQDLTRAFSVDTVVQGPFASWQQTAPELPEPVVTRWPRPMRGAVMVTGAAIGWGLVALVGALV